MFSRNKSQYRSRLLRGSRYLESIIGPTTKLHVAVLIIKREPRDVYLACALEDARWHIQTTAVMFDHNICVERAIESLIRTMSVYTIVVLIEWMIRWGLIVNNFRLHFHQHALSLGCLSRVSIIK